MHAPARTAVPVLLLVAASLVGCQGFGEIAKSQEGGVTQTVGHTNIEIDYRRPVARGRALFGGIVPLGEPWNPGANQATSIRFDREVQVEGLPVPAGRYSIWMIPDSTAWTFILSRAGDVFHTPYPEGQDALRVSITPRTAEYVETLAFYFPTVDSTRAELVMHWGETVVPIRIDAP